MRRAVIALALATGLALGAAPSASAQQGGGFDVRVLDSATFPDREVILSLPAARALKRSDLKLRENDRPVRDLVLTSEAQNSERGLVLAIDASESMRGAPIEAAMVAARSFARRRPAKTPLGVVFFSREARVALAPTTDGRAIDALLRQTPALTRGTQAFDASMASIKALRDAKLKSGAVLLLSDGADVGSSTTADQLSAAARQTSTRIFSVGLRSPSYDGGTLQLIAARANGRYAEAQRTEDLPPIFAAIGQRLSAEQRVAYRSVAPAGSSVRVEATIAGVPGVARTTYDTPELPLGTFKEPPTATEAGLSSAEVAMIAIGAALLIGLLVALFLMPRRRDVTERIADFAGGPGLPATAVDEALARPAKSDRETSERWQAFEDAVDLSGYRMNARTLALVTGICTVLAMYYFGGATGQPLLAPLALIVPLFVRAAVMARVNLRRREFEEQLPDNLQVLASALRAGFSFSAALATMCDDAPEPSRSELRRAVTDEQLGVDVEEALGRVARRMDSEELEYVGVVARQQRDAGGNTADVLEQVIETIRQRHQLKRLVRTLTSQGRFGGAVVSVLPLLVAAGMATTNPDYFDPMFESTAGKLMFVAAGLMLAAGWLSIRKIVDVTP